MAPRPTRKDRQVRDQLVEAAQVLRSHDRADLADAVDYTLSPKGWPMLGRLLSEQGPSSSTANLQIMFQRRVLDCLRAAVAAGPADDAFTRLVEEGLTAFVEGAWRPAQAPAPVPVAQSERADLTVRVDSALRDRALAVAEAAAGELGWRPTLPMLGRLWLFHRFPEAERLHVSLARPSQKRPNFPIGVRPEVRAHLQAAVAADPAGKTLAEVAEEGLAAFIDGTWRPATLIRSYDGDGRVNLNLRPDPELRRRAQEVAQGVPGRPGVTPLILTWLLERYPLPGGTE